MKQKNIPLFALSAALLLSGCNTDQAVTTTAAEVTTTTAASTTTTAANTTTTTWTTTSETTAEPELEPPVAPVLSIDLNNDGTDEDFYIDGDHYRIVMHTQDGDKTAETFGRPDKFYTYKDSAGTYCYSYVESGIVEKGFSQYNFIVWDNGFFVWQAFGMSCSTGEYLTCREYKEAVEREEFDSAFFDPQFLAGENPEAEIKYIGTLEIDELVNRDRTEYYLKTIDLATGALPIEVYALDNDAFGAGRMFKCGDRTLFSDDYRELTAYSRFPEITPAGDGWKLSDPIKSDRREYLLCLRSHDIETTDLIYMGYPDEGYLVHYDKPVPADKVDDYLAGQGWKLRSEEIDISYFRYSAPDEEKVVFDREKAAAAYSDYGTGLDVIPGSERKLVFCTDEEEFGEPELLKKIREAYYNVFTEKIKRHNESDPESHSGDNVLFSTLVPARTINEPADIPFVKGMHFDFDNDGEDEILAMVGIEVWECVFFYADGDRIINFTINDFADVNNDPDVSDDEYTELCANDVSVWDFGKYRFMTHTVGGPNIAFTTIYRCTDGCKFEGIDHIAANENWFNEAGYVLIRHHPNIYVLPDYLICTTDGELKELAAEELDTGTFREIYEKDAQMKAAFDKLGLDIDTVTGVQHIGYYDFVVTSSEKFDRSPIARYSDGIAYEVFEGHGMSSDESLLHGINLYKLNVIGG